MFIIGLIVAVLLVALASGLQLNSNYVPTPQDEALRMEAAGTVKTADFAGTPKLLGINFTPGGIGQASCAVVDITAMDFTSTDETYKWQLMESADGVTFTACGPIVQTTATGVYSIPGFISQPYAALSLDVGGTTPSVTYQAWFNPNVF